ncbi:dTDP-4-dehydrorhamnose 3,5-epimerase [Brevibacillus sp. NRS-1366]|uniref:dTDP-4-dehydrorhamnose 3,5-epimerase n=1 Tax=Brevibacillus sp. NRS-1366 TaxID=3233899 RepID=UPI003D20E374
MNFAIQKTKIPGCYEMVPKRFTDQRGAFIKTFHKDEFAENQLHVHFAEEYHSISSKGVLRGLHFQIPPKDHVKIVYCVFGEIMDVVVDLRVGSPAYGAYEIFQLSADKANMVYIPTGLAHGFYVCREPAIVMYKASTVHAPEFDSGIHWASLGIEWPDRNPIISEKDSELPPFHKFKSPFRYQEM